MVRPPEPEYVAFLAELGSGIQRLALDARAVVLAAAPRSHELVYDAYNAVAVAFTLTGRLKDAFAHVAAYSSHVNLGFNQGAALPDPAARLRGTGKVIRHVRLVTAADLSDSAVHALLSAAVARAALPAADNGAPAARVNRTTGRRRRPSPPAN